MISAPAPDDAGHDWDSWRAPLDQFAQATGLTVTAYDIDGARRVGPLTPSATAQLLAGGTLWHDEGEGSALERRLVRAMVQGESTDFVFHGMRVAVLPLTHFGQAYGALVYGWRFGEFSSPMECEQIGAKAGVSGQALWNTVRLEPPVSGARLATYTALLDTLAGTIDRQSETIEELHRVSRARELFLATVSHEMRTPLSALSMRVEVLLKTVKDLPKPVESALLAMRVHVRQEAGMIDDLIDAARTLNGQMSVNRVRASLGRIVRDAVSTIEVQAHEKAIALSVAPPDQGDSITINADGHRLQQVLWNLLLNAVKFTPPGGAIKIRIVRSASHVDIDVADNGQGIQASELAHVFDAFTLQTQGNASGLGLGLYIARRIVELHDGTLTVASAGKNLGTTFTMRLPLEPA
ncbi:MAG: HAMP domain-containing sensor histidine kinase [Telluria sp.]